ncbi:MAG TPA: polymer-forming cytoskeletal protein [Kofleriaceae bacterium]|jgi:hypothetical protein
MAKAPHKYRLDLDDSIAAPLRTHIERMLSISPTWAEVEELRKKAKAWRPDVQHFIVNGDLTIDGNIIVGTGKHDHGVVIVMGNISCKNLVVASGFSLVCVGNLTATEAIVAQLPDSTTYVGGKVKAKLLASGRGAWMTVFDAKQLAGAKLSGYAMVGARPHSPTRKVDLAKVLVSGALDEREWRAMDADERKVEKQADYVDINVSGVFKLLAKGASILR